MRRWQVRWRLIILGAAAIAGGLVVPFLPDERARTDILAGGLVLGGIAMITVALLDIDRNGG